MGKQITFFMTANDEKSFIEFIKNNDDIMINDSGNKINEIGEQVSYISGKRRDPETFSKIFIQKVDSQIFKNKNKFVDETLSEVIEFSRCEIMNDNELWNGRIWFQNKYYNEKGELINKPEWLDKQYGIYQKWIRKNLKKSNVGDFYIGQEAYKLYKEKIFVMKNAPKVDIEFDV